MSTVEKYLKRMTREQFQHRWLSEEFAEESRRQAESENSKEHHYVPRFYLDRWAVDGLIQPTQVDAGVAYSPQRPKDVGKKTNFYSIPRSGDTIDLPLKWVEKHLSRIESDCIKHFESMDSLGSGKVVEDSLKRDMSVFLALQLARTPSHRERSMVIINGPEAAKREWLKRTRPQATATQIQESLKPRYSDPKREALHLMLADVRNGGAQGLYLRRWAIYRTVEPIATCDDPVIAIAGPTVSRSISLGLLSAVIIYPLGPHQLLVLLRPDHHHRPPLTLTADEVSSVNLEIASAATRTVFERPGDGIAGNVSVPARYVPELDDETAANLSPERALAMLLNEATRRRRWPDDSAAPDWPVPRWYR
ncbi:DUF4238 domain-containing protein [Nocardia gipuzkoensis]